MASCTPPGTSCPCKHNVARLCATECLQADALKGESQLHPSVDEPHHLWGGGTSICSVSLLPRNHQQSLTRPCIAGGRFYVMTISSLCSAGGGVSTVLSMRYQLHRDLQDWRCASKLMCHRVHSQQQQKQRERHAQCMARQSPNSSAPNSNASAMRYRV